MRSGVGVEKFGVDAHTILHTCNWSKRLEACYEAGRKDFCIATYLAVALSAPPQHRNPRRSRNSCISAGQSKDDEPKCSRVRRRGSSWLRHLPIGRTRLGSGRTPPLARAVAPYGPSRASAPQWQRGRVGSASAVEASLDSGHGDRGEGLHVSLRIHGDRLHVGTAVPDHMMSGGCG